MAALKVLFLLESVDLSGGVSIVFRLCEQLKKTGVNPLILYLKGDHSWYRKSIPLKQVEALYSTETATHFSPDVVIATFYTTVNPALHYSTSRIFHLCQGYEGCYSFYKDRINEIRKSYSEPVPKIVIAKWLKPFLEKEFNHAFEVFYMGQLLNREFYSNCLVNFKYLRKKKVSTILVPGPFSFREKGVRLALLSLKRLKERGVIFRLIRISSVENQTLKEKELIDADEFYVDIPPEKVKSLYKKTDLLLSTPDTEGFGLPVAEAMCMGIAVVATPIEPYKTEFESDSPVIFTPSKKDEDIAELICKVIQNRKMLKSASEKGLSQIKKYPTDKKVTEHFINIISRSESC